MSTSWRQLKALPEPQAEEAGGLKRVLGVGSIAAIGIGCTIGTGIFVMPGLAAEAAGPAMILSFFLAALASAIAALSYCELAVLIPTSGSAYAYSYVAFGRLAAWLIGWALLLEYALSNSAVAAGWGGYLHQLLSTVGLGIPEAWRAAPGQALPGGGVGLANLPAAAAILLVTGLLCLGIRESARVNNLLVIAKIMVLAIFVALVGPTVEVTRFTPFMPHGWNGVVNAAALLFFLFIGFDAVSTVADEAKDPQRDLPRGILLALAVVTALYVGVGLVLVGAIPLDTLAKLTEPLAIGLEGAGHPWVAKLLSTVAVVGILGVLIAASIGQTRILFAMARDGLMPAWMAKVNPDRGTPIASTVAMGLVTALMAALVPLDALADLVSIGTLVAFIAVSLAVLALRQRYPEAPRRFHCPGVPWLPLLGVGINLYLITGLGAPTKWFFLSWMGMGLLAYMAGQARAHHAPEA